MLTTLIKLLGSPYVIPLAFIALAGWGIKHVLELASFRRQHRRDFLDLWDEARCDDNLRLEVLTRHLVGEYLPAAVVRGALKDLFPSRMLLDIAAAWSDLRFEQVTGTVVLARDRYRSRGFRAFMAAVWLVGYVACALATWRFGTWAWTLGPTHPMGWLHGLAAVALAIVAVACVGKEHSVRQLGRVNSSLLTRLNAHLTQTGPTPSEPSGASPPASSVLQAAALPDPKDAAVTRALLELAETPPPSALMRDRSSEFPRRSCGASHE